MSEDENFEYPKKKRLWSPEFKFRAKRYWRKTELPGKYGREWVPETPPKMPTDNPWVDSLIKSPTAPESQQTCHPSVWKYGSQYRNGARYRSGQPFVDKDGWFILWNLRAFGFLGFLNSGIWIFRIFELHKWHYKLVFRHFINLFTERQVSLYIQLWEKVTCWSITYLATKSRACMSKF